MRRTAAVAGLSGLVIGNNLLIIDSNGDLSKIKKVPYSWPASQGSSSTVLTNDGAGNLSWGSSGSGTLSIGAAVTGGGAGRLLYEDASQNLASSANATYDGTTLVLGPDDARRFRFGQVSGVASLWMSVSSPFDLVNYTLINAISITALNNASRTELRVGNTTCLSCVASGSATTTNVQYKLVAQGIVSQSTNLHEYQDSSAVVLTSYDAAGRLRFNTAAAGVSNEGAVWADSTQKALQTYVDGIEQTLSGTIFTQTADQTVTNTTTETTILGSGVGTKTLPANFFVAGKTIRLRIGGIYSTPAVATPSIIIKVKYGSTTIATVTTSSLLSGASNLEFDGEVLITCRTTGSSGTVMVHGDIEYATGVAGTISVDPLNNAGATTTINTTTSNAIDVTAQWDSATSTRIGKSTISTMEVLN